MSKITFLPVGKTVDMIPGDTILETAIQHDVPLQHACGGFCACTTCHVYVQSGAENLDAMEEDESERIFYVDARHTESRLGCQSKLKKGATGDITVTMVNLDE
jgi:2Fe-2S ferredoxin